MTDDATPTDPFDLTGHVTVVTGGATGIGLGMATGLARAGATVVLLARTAQRLEAAATSLRSDGNPVLALPCDVTDEQAVTDAMARVRGEFGRLDRVSPTRGCAAPSPRCWRPRWPSSGG